MRKRLTAWLLVTALLVTLTGGILPASALWVKSPMPMGDVNEDGEINTTDARLVLQFAVSKIEFTDSQYYLAMVSGNEEPNTTDARLILQFSVGKLDEFPCGEVYSYSYSEAETTPNENPDEFADYTSGNPIVTSMFTADPSAHVWKDGRIYVYASHDIFPPRGCDLMNKPHVFSSDNMVDWVDEGELMSSDDVLWSNCDGFMWAPDCVYIEETETYYYFFPHPITNEDGSEWNATWVMGVASSKSPVGPFTQLGYVKLPDELAGDSEEAPAGTFDSSAYSDRKARDGKTLGEHGTSGLAIGGYSLIDPCVFVDDDGTIYLYYGGGSNCYVVELADDMVTAATAPRKIFGLTDFHEGAWVFKNPDNGIYYLMYADNNSGHNRQRYAMSRSPIGPFNYAGIILDETDCDTSHGSIVQYKGNWYMFYHNSVLSGQGNLRSVCVDRLYFNEDGKIQKVMQTTTGVAAVGPASPSATGGTNISKDAFTVATDYVVEGNDNVTTGGGAILNSTGSAVGNLHINGSYCTFSGIDGGKGGKALLTVTYATPNNSSAKVTTSADKSDEGYFLRLYGTGGYQAYDNGASCIIDLNEGTDNTITFHGGSGFNLKAITVSLLPENATA